MTGVEAAQYAAVAAGIAILAAWAARARRGADALGPAPAAPLPDTSRAVFIAVPAWFLASFVVGAVAQSAGLSWPALLATSGLVHLAISLVLLPMVRAGARSPGVSVAREVATGVLAGVVTFAAVAVVGQVVTWGYGLAGSAPPEQDAVAIARTSAGLDRAVVLASVVVLAPFGEEVFWRGALLPAMARRMPVPTAVVVQGLLFGAAHFLLGAPVASWPLAIPLALVGILAGWIYVRTGSLGATVLVHATFNALNMTFIALS